MPRSVLSVVLASLALFLASCAGSRSASSTERRSAPEATTSSASSTTEADHGAAEPRTPAPDPGPPPVLALRGTPSRGARGVEIVVENRGEDLARVAPSLALERRGEGGRFEPVRSVQLALRAGCDTPPPECLELAPGAALHPPAWLGTEGDAQCGCERCTPAEPGTYRFVARSCGGTHVVPGEPFELTR